MRFLYLILLLAWLPLSADEGMWQPHQLPSLSSLLNARGLVVDPGSLNSLTEHPMAAIVSLGGCSASFVSPDGLAVTNYHCIQSSLQHNSTPQQNLLEDGFMATNRDQELPGRPGSRMYVTVAVSDVSTVMLEDLSDDMDGLDRQRQLEQREKQLINDCEADPGHRCNVHAFYQGLAFYLVKQLELRDVRLVYVPSRSIGAFGGNVDNWMWPRHTGDYSFLRAYVAADGSPADFHEDNVPYHPEHYLAVSTRGLKAGDFVMAAGYPGSTYRHRLAMEAADVSGWFYPASKTLFEQMRQVIAEQTAGRDEAAIRYSALMQGLDNVIKNYELMLQGFSGSGLVQRKQRQEAELRAWLEARQSTDNSLDALISLITEYREGREQRLIYDDFLRRRAALLDAASVLYRLSMEAQKPDSERKLGYQQRDRDRIAEKMRSLERSFDARVDRALLEHHLGMYTQLPREQRIAAFDEWLGKDVSLTLDRAYEQTTLGHSAARLEWMDAEPEQFRRSSDPFIRLAVALYDSDLQREQQRERYLGRFQYARARYMQMLRRWYAELERPLYPDANGTLRVTFGAVQGYSPRDAVYYRPFTTLQGLLEKATGREPFDAPAALLAAVDQQMAQSPGQPVKVNFLATLDATGGNSGSAVLDAEAELVGLLFDGNHASINADWYFDESDSRTICVDIRYVLWIMDTVDGAHHLLREMGIGPGALP